MDLIGKPLGNYQIVSELGRGGMGIVYRAYQASLNRYVAIKVLPPQLAIDETFVQRFLHEARASAQLQHPNIVTIYDVGSIEHIYYIVMAEIRGEPLSALVRRSGRLPLDRAVSIVSQVASALDFAHAQGIVHRDIKPSNILVDANDRAVLTDFGIAKAATGANVTRTGVVVGTPEYMSPEQARGTPVDHRSDIYSLGVIAYELMGGRAPFVGDTLAVLHAHAYEPLPSLRTLNPEVSKDVERVIAQAMAKKPEERWPSAGAFAAALTASIQQVTAKIGSKRGKATTTPVPTPRGTPVPRSTPAPIPAPQATPRSLEAATMLATSPPAVPTSPGAATTRRRPSWALFAAIGLVVVGAVVLVMLMAGGTPPPTAETVSNAAAAQPTVTETALVPATSTGTAQAVGSVSEPMHTIIVELGTTPTQVPATKAPMPTMATNTPVVVSKQPVSTATATTTPLPTIPATATPTATRPRPAPTATPKPEPATPTSASLPAPVLVQPADGWGDPSDAVTFQWQTVPGAIGYVVETRPESSGQGDWRSWGRVDGTSLTLSYDVEGQYFNAPGTVYLWRVAALNNIGKVGSYSATHRFVFQRPTSGGNQPPETPTDTPQPPPPPVLTDTPAPPTDTPEPPPPPPPTDTPEPPPPPPPTDTPEPTNLSDA